MKKHDYNQDVYYENVDEKLLNEQSTVAEGEASAENSQVEQQEAKTLENFSGQPKMSEQEHIRAYYTYNQEAEKLAAAIRKEEIAKLNRQSLILALVGLFLSLVFGLGLFFSIPAWAKACIRLKQTKSQMLTWAKTLAVLGTFLNAFVLLAFIIFICV